MFQKQHCFNAELQLQLRGDFISISSQETCRSRRISLLSLVIALMAFKCLYTSTDSRFYYGFYNRREFSTHYIGNKLDQNIFIVLSGSIGGRMKLFQQQSVVKHRGCYYFERIEPFWISIHHSHAKNSKELLKKKYN